MEKNEFKAFCKKELYKRGYRKVKNVYYLCGNKGVLSSVDLQKSNYGESYYINFYFFIGNYEDVSPEFYPSLYEYDIYERIAVISKTQKYKGEYVKTGTIEYKEYTEEELRSVFDQEFENRILPPITQGKRYILDNLETLYTLDLRQEEVMKKLLNKI